MLMALRGRIVPTQRAMLMGVVVKVVLPQALVVVPILKFSGQKTGTKRKSPLGSPEEGPGLGV